MKSWVAFEFFSLILLVFLAGCILPFPPAATPTPTPQPTPEVTPAVTPTATPGPLARMEEPVKYAGLWLPLEREVELALGNMSSLKAAGVNTVAIPILTKKVDNRTVAFDGNETRVKEWVARFRTESIRVMLVVNPAYPESGVRFTGNDSALLPSLSEFAVEWAGKAEEMQVEMFMPVNEPQAFAGDGEISVWAQELLPRLKGRFSGKLAFCVIASGNGTTIAVHVYNTSGYDYVAVQGITANNMIDSNPRRIAERITSEELPAIEGSYGSQELLFFGFGAFTGPDYYSWEPIAPANMPREHPEWPADLFVVSEQGQADYYDLFFNLTWNRSKGYFVTDLKGWEYRGKPAEAVITNWYSKLAPRNSSANAYAHKYALVMSGYSGTERHAGWFRGSTNGMYQLLVNSYGFAPEDVYYLFEEKNYSEIDYQATKENFAAAVHSIQMKSTGDDLIAFYIVGHGNNVDGHGIYSLADSQLHDYEFSALLEGMQYKRMVIVLTPCNSGAFIPSLSGENRILVTSVKADEGNSAGFAEMVIAGLGKQDATIASAFEEATDGVNGYYTTRGYAPQEHPLLDDNGDGVGHTATLPNGGDGFLAQVTSLNSFNASLAGE